MKKTLLIVALCTALSAQADEYVTAGDGTLYDFERLASIAESGVSLVGEQLYEVTKDVTIAEGDSFAMAGRWRANLGSGVRITFKGVALLQPEEGVFGPITSDDGEVSTPYGLSFENAHHATHLSDVKFFGCGVRCFSPFGLRLTRCTFMQHNGVSGSSALQMGPDLAPFEVRECIFGSCQRSAIGGAANYRNPLLVEQCVFIRNGQDNRNAPQLNLTVADSVVVRHCVLLGDSTKTLVGGIVVSNLLGFSGDYQTLIEDNDIRHHRFGVATYLRQHAVIRDNKLVDNHHETNANNGGSGINIYDPQQQQTAHIEGNRIEGNLWGITVIGGQQVNVGRTDVDASSPDYNPGRNIFLNNQNGGQVYDLYNNSAHTVYAQGNYWLSASEQSEAGIESVIFHQYDNASLGQVVYAPWGDAGLAGVAGVCEVAGPSAKSYSLDGRRVNGVRRGLVLRRENGRVRKVVVR